MNSNKKTRLIFLIFGMLLLLILAILYARFQRYIPTQLNSFITSQPAVVMPKPLSEKEIEDIKTHQPIQNIHVYKSARVVRLIHQGEIVREYPMRLGFDPIGHKQQEGDGKTPEGRYSIDWRNPNSAFYKSLHISYPNTQDRSAAVRRGVSPGGEIMIHGSTTSTVAKQPGMMQYLPQSDWTLGCISVRNVDIDEIWKLVKNNTQIEIYP